MTIVHVLNASASPTGEGEGEFPNKRELRIFVRRAKQHPSRVLDSGEGIAAQIGFLSTQRHIFLI